MRKNSVQKRISKVLDSKIKAYQSKYERLTGVKISYVQASQGVAKEL